MYILLAISYINRKLSIWVNVVYSHLIVYNGLCMNRMRYEYGLYIVL